MAAVERRKVDADLGRRWLAANRRARRKGMLPVLALSTEGLPGRLLVVHEFDLAAVAAAQPQSTQP